MPTKILSFKPEAFSSLWNLFSQVDLNSQKKKIICIYNGFGVIFFKDFDYKFISILVFFNTLWPVFSTSKYIRRHNTDYQPVVIIN